MAEKQLNDYSVWTAIITPFDKNGNIDAASFKKLLKKQDAAGNAVLILGSTGESLALSLTEKKQIIDITLNEKLNVPIMVGVGGTYLPEQIEWVKYLETTAVDSYLIVTPLYAKPGTQGQINWFKSLLDISSRDCMLYNVPSRTGVKMSFDAVATLKDHPRFWALKEASGNTEDFDKYVKAAPKVRVYSGDDGLTPAFCELGCKGVVSVMSNVWPELTNKFMQICLDAKTPEVEELWPKLADTLFIQSNPIPAKALMTGIGLIESSHTRAPLAAQDLQSTGVLIEANQIANNWIENN